MQKIVENPKSNIVPKDIQNNWGKKLVFHEAS